MRQRNLPRQNVPASQKEPVTVQKRMWDAPAKTLMCNVMQSPVFSMTVVNAVQIISVLQIIVHPAVVRRSAPALNCNLLLQLKQARHIKPGLRCCIFLYQERNKMDYNINFPHLHIYLDHVIKTISIGSFDIAMYGVIIAFGMMMGVFVASYVAKKSGQNPDTYFDLALVAIICSVIGARIYYVVFRWDLYKDDLLSIFNIRQGGLAIYGGVIAAIITTFVFSRVKKVSFPLLCDTAGLGLIIGQVIGRWGNFCNREAFGDYYDGLFAMQLPISAVRSSDLTEKLLSHTVVVDGVEYISVHPTFLYESVWNLCLFIILMIYFKHRKFNGEVFLLYLLGYGVGRFWIESLRTDQLLIPHINYPVSMALAATMAVVSFIWIVIVRSKQKKLGKMVDNPPQSTTEE